MRARRNTMPRLRAPLRSERGVALPTAISMLFIIGMLAGVASTAAITANSQSNRGRAVARAVAAADAGANVAQHRLNKGLPWTNLGCLTSDEAGVLRYVPYPVGEDWCDPEEEDLGEGASWSFQVSKGELLGVCGRQLWEKEIVSTGIVQMGNGREVKRRILVTVNMVDNGSTWGDNAAFGSRSLTLQDTSSVTGRACSSTGNIELEDSSVLCGLASVSAGNQVKLGASANHFAPPACSGPGSTLPTQESPPLNLVDEEEAWDDERNDNGDWVLGPGALWDENSRTLTIYNHQTVTLNLSGDTYSFCDIRTDLGPMDVGGAIDPGVRPPGSNPVKIFIHSPEWCDANLIDPSRPSGGPQGEYWVGIDNEGLSAGGPAAKDMQLLVAGSGQQDTTLYLPQAYGGLDAPSSADMAVYAPRSTVKTHKYSQGADVHTINGCVAARDLVLTTGVVPLKYSTSCAYADGSTIAIFSPYRWVECSPKRPDPLNDPPDAGCDPAAS